MFSIEFACQFPFEHEIANLFAISNGSVVSISKNASIYWLIDLSKCIQCSKGFWVFSWQTNVYGPRLLQIIFLSRFVSNFRFFFQLLTVPSVTLRK
jgi:hypothetical protein